jgi:hypothetical protein
MVSTSTAPIWLAGCGARSSRCRNTTSLSGTSGATRRLTLNIGVHYEINGPFTERNNYWANFDRDSARLLLAGKNASPTAGIDTDDRSVGPRFGFAYQAAARPSCAEATASSSRRRAGTTPPSGSSARCRTTSSSASFPERWQLLPGESEYGSYRHFACRLVLG